MMGARGYGEPLIEKLCSAVTAKNAARREAGEPVSHKNIFGLSSGRAHVPLAGDCLRARYYRAGSRAICSVAVSF
jgi:hypothetical protein